VWHSLVPILGLASGLRSCKLPPDPMAVLCAQNAFHQEGEVELAQWILIAPMVSVGTMGANRTLVLVDHAMDSSFLPGDALLICTAICRAFPMLGALARPHKDNSTFAQEVTLVGSPTGGFTNCDS